MTARLHCAAVSDLGRYLSTQDKSDAFDEAIESEKIAILSDEERVSILAEMLIDRVFSGNEKALSSLLSFVAKELIKPAHEDSKTAQEYLPIFRVAVALLEETAVKSITAKD